MIMNKKVETIEILPKFERRIEDGLPDFWLRLVDEMTEGNEFVSEETPIRKGNSSLILDVQKIIEENNDLLDDLEIDVEIDDVEGWRFQLEAYRRVLKEKISASKKNFENFSSPVNRAKLRFAEEKYEYFKVVVKDEYVKYLYSYNLLKNEKEIDEFGFSKKDYYLKLKSIYEEIANEDSEVFELLRRLLKKTLKLIFENKSSKDSLERLTRDRDNLICIKDDLEQEKAVLEKEVERLDGLLERRMQEGAVQGNQEIEKLREEITTLRLQLALIDQSSKMKSNEVLDYKKRAEEGDLAVKRLNDELENINDLVEEHQDLQARFHELNVLLEKITLEKEVLEEELENLRMDFAVRKEYGGGKKTSEEQEEFLRMKREIKEYRQKIYDYELHIAKLVEKNRIFETVYDKEIRAILSDLSRRLTFVSSDVACIKGAVLDDAFAIKDDVLDDGSLGKK